MRILGVNIEKDFLSYMVLENNIVVDKKYIRIEEGNVSKIKEVLNNKFIKKFEKIIFTGEYAKTIIKKNHTQKFVIYEKALKDFSGQNLVINLDDDHLRIYNFEDGNKFTSIIRENVLDVWVNSYFQKILEGSSEGVHKYDIGETICVSEEKCFLECKTIWDQMIGKGEKLENILVSVSDVIANKIAKMIKNLEYDNLFIVGKSTDNDILINTIRNKVKNAIVPYSSDYFELYNMTFLNFNEYEDIEDINDVLKIDKSEFEYYEPLNTYINKVKHKYEELHNEEEYSQDVVVGLDVGDVLTKCVVIEKYNSKIVDKFHVENNIETLDTVAELLGKLKIRLGKKYNVISFSVVGKDREIVSKYLEDANLTNEDRAIKAAMDQIDKSVDSIIDLGGKSFRFVSIKDGDIKYYKEYKNENIIASLFLKHVSEDVLGIAFDEIDDYIIKGTRPIKFNTYNIRDLLDEINMAMSNNVKKEDILTGVIYSIAKYYLEKLEVEDKIGDTVTLKGGLAKINSFAMAFAGLIGKDINLYENPMFFDAYGTALDAVDKIKKGTLEEKHIYIDKILSKQVVNMPSFICNGGLEKCKEECVIKQVMINERVYPYGGNCNKFINLLTDNVELDFEKNNFIAIREKIIDKYLDNEVRVPKGKIYMNRSFDYYDYSPIFYNFFTKLGYVVDIKEDANVEMNHFSCRAANKIYAPIKEMDNEYDYYFKALRKDRKNVISSVKQGELDYHRNLSNKPDNKHIVAFIENNNFYKKEIFEKIAIKDLEEEEFEVAYEYALKMQRAYEDEIREYTNKILQSVDRHKKEIMFVVFGKKYNIYDEEANAGLIHSLITRGYKVVPYDFLINNISRNIETYIERSDELLNVMEYVKRKNKLYGIYIGSASCKEDATLIEYFKDIMKDKPSYAFKTDAMVNNNRENNIRNFIDNVKHYYKSSEDAEGEQLEIVIDSKLSRSETGKVYIPVINKYIDTLYAATLRSYGFDVEIVRDFGNKDLDEGKNHISQQELLLEQKIVGNIINNNKLDKSKKKFHIPYVYNELKVARTSSVINSILKSYNEDMNLIKISLEEMDLETGYDFSKKMFMSTMIAEYIERISDDYDVDEVLNEVSNILEKEHGMDILTKLKEYVNSIDIEFNKSADILILGESLLVKNEFFMDDLKNRLKSESLTYDVVNVHEQLKFFDYVKGNMRKEKDINNKIKDYAHLFFKDKESEYLKEIFGVKKYDEYKCFENIDKYLKSQLISEAKYILANCFKFDEKYKGAILVSNSKNTAEIEYVDLIVKEVLKLDKPIAKINLHEGRLNIIAKDKINVLKIKLGNAMEVK